LVRRGVGDTVAATPLVRDLISGYSTAVAVVGAEAAAVFENFPGVVPPETAGLADVTLDYAPAYDRAHAGRAAKYLYAAHEAFEAATGVAVDRGPDRPVVHLSAAERVPPRAGRYWVVASGVKPDVPVKQWPHAHFAALVAAVPEVDWVQVGLLHDGRFTHHQRHVPGAVNMLGRTAVRDLIRLIAHAAGVVCHLSLPFMVARAVGTPCVVLAGNREPAWFHTPTSPPDLTVAYLEAAGRGLPCATRYGCNVRVANPPAGAPPGWACAAPVEDPAGGLGWAKCMDVITPAEAAGHVRRLNAGAGRVSII
jgi:ADP-heptose:LPS heptosyltransferase